MTLIYGTPRFRIGKPFPDPARQSRASQRLCSFTEAGTHPSPGTRPPRSSHSPRGEAKAHRRAQPRPGARRPPTPSQPFARKWDPRYLVLPPPPPRWHGPLHRAAIAATRASIEEMNEIPGQPAETDYEAVEQFLLAHMAQKAVAEAPEPSPDRATLETGVGPGAPQQEVDPATAAWLSPAMPDQHKDVFS